MSNARAEICRQLTAEILVVPRRLRTLTPRQSCPSCGVIFGVSVRHTNSLSAGDEKTGGQSFCALRHHGPVSTR